MAGSDSSRKPLKELELVADTKYPSMFRLKFKGGGKLPAKLTGLYNRKTALKAIDDYVEGYDRPKIYPSAPKNDKPTRRAKKNGEDQDIS